jgi:hypothetical protein
LDAYKRKSPGWRGFQVVFWSFLEALKPVAGGEGVRKRAVRRTSMQPRKPLILLKKT